MCTEENSSRIGLCPKKVEKKSKIIMITIYWLLTLFALQQQPHDTDFIVYILKNEDTRALKVYISWFWLNSLDITKSKFHQVPSFYKVSDPTYDTEMEEKGKEKTNEWIRLQEEDDIGDLQKVDWRTKFA